MINERTIAVLGLVSVAAIIGILMTNFAMCATSIPDLVSFYFIP